MAQGKQQRPSAAKSAVEPKQHGLGVLLLVVGLSTGLFAILGVLAAHFFH